MVFRDRAEARGDGTLERYFALISGFGLDLGKLGDRVPLLLAAAALLRHGGDPHQLIRETLDASRAIERHEGWLEIHGRSLRLVIAAILVANRLEPEPFVSERSALFDVFELFDVHYSPVHRTLAVLGLRLSGGVDGPITGVHVRRMQSIYAAIAGRFRAFCDARLLAVCGLLAGHGDLEPDAIAGRVEGVYKLLRRRARLSWGLPLLSMSTVLATREFEIEAISTRVGEIVGLLHDTRLGIDETRYEELAVLSLLALPTDRIVEVVRRYDARIEAHFGWGRDVPINFVLAVDLLLADCVTSDARLGPLIDLKLALDATA